MKTRTWQVGDRLVMRWSTGAEDFRGVITNLREDETGRQYAEIRTDEGVTRGFRMDQRLGDSHYAIRLRPVSRGRK